MRITKRQLRRIIKEAVSNNAMSALKDAVADATVAKSSIGRRATGVDVRKDKDFQVEWGTQHAFRVTIRGTMGQKEQWQVVGDIETGVAKVIGRV